MTFFLVPSFTRILIALLNCIKYSFILNAVFSNHVFKTGHVFHADKSP